MLSWGSSIAVSAEMVSTLPAVPSRMAARVAAGTSFGDLHGFTIAASMRLSHVFGETHGARCAGMGVETIVVHEGFVPPQGNTIELWYVCVIS